MCSGCAGDYEGDGDHDQWGPVSEQASPSDTVDGDSPERDKSTWPAAFRTRTHGHERNERKAGETQAESECEVLVSANEIIEIRRIKGDFAGLS